MSKSWIGQGLLFVSQTKDEFVESGAHCTFMNKLLCQCVSFKTIFEAEKIIPQERMSERFDQMVDWSCASCRNI